MAEARPKQFSKEAMYRMFVISDKFGKNLFNNKKILIAVNSCRNSWIRFRIRILNWVRNPRKFCRHCLFLFNKVMITEGIEPS
jgi:hypothetical protein